MSTNEFGEQIMYADLAASMTIPAFPAGIRSTATPTLDASITLLGVARRLTPDQLSKQALATRIANRASQSFGIDDPEPVMVRRLSFRHNDEGINGEIARMMRQAQS